MPFPLWEIIACCHQIAWCLLSIDCWQDTSPSSHCRLSWSEFSGSKISFLFFLAPAKGEILLPYKELITELLEKVYPCVCVSFLHHIYMHIGWDLSAHISVSYCLIFIWKRECVKEKQKMSVKLGVIWRVGGWVNLLIKFCFWLLSETKNEKMYYRKQML